MLLAGLILLAACANLGSLFAARAADRARRLLCDSHWERTHTHSAGALYRSHLISLAGGAVGLWGSVALLRGLRVWQPSTQVPSSTCPFIQDANVYLDGFVVAPGRAVPLWRSACQRQVLRTDPYQVVKSGSLGKAGWRRLPSATRAGGQIAICAVLVLLRWWQSAD